MLVLAVGGMVGVLWFASTITGADPEPPSETRIEMPTPVSIVPVAQPANLAFIETDVADEMVRAVVGELSSHPVLASWLVTDRIAHRFVAAVDAMAGGYSPREDLDILRPHQHFFVRDDDVLGLVIAEGSFRRYDVVTNAFASIDMTGAVELYRELEPLFEQIHQQISWGQDGFEERLREAVDHVLDVNVPEGQLEVERRVLTYAFADPDLEDLSRAQRHLLRMGPANARTVQAKLEQLRAAFGWPEAAAEDSQRPISASMESDPDPEPALIAHLESSIESVPEINSTRDREEAWAVTSE
jgi:hypothetical protein